MEAGGLEKGVVAPRSASPPWATITSVAGGASLHKRVFELKNRWTDGKVSNV